MVVTTKNMSFVQNLYEAEKIELISEFTFHTYRDASLFSLTAASRGNILDVGNPYKERDT